PVFGIEVWSGDMISVPLGTRHWFDLCTERRIRAVRLFQDQTGWTPHYLSNAVHNDYEPLCLGPDYLKSSHGETS
ncbi:MAG: acireductone dioxygenase, partial [Planctomycetaceae bacterium]|nr:acireductone dioxygenase [Planctomycetaceae bacterium]